MNTNHCYVSGELVKGPTRSSLNRISPQNLEVKLVAVGSSIVVMYTFDNKLIKLASDLNFVDITDKLPDTDRNVKMIAAGGSWVALTDKSIYEEMKQLKTGFNVGLVKKLISKFGGIAVITHNSDLYICENRDSFTKVTIGDTRFFHASFGSSHSLILSESGILFTKGSNTYHQLGIDSQENNSTLDEYTRVDHKFAPIKFAECGYFHSIVITIENEIYGVGWNAVGELGDGTVGDKSTWVKATFSVPNNLEIVYLSVGYQQSFVALTNGSVYCCGFNNYGGLGLGDVECRSTYQIFPTNRDNGSIHVNRPIAGGHFTFYCLDPNFNIRKSEQEFKTKLWKQVQKQEKISDLAIYIHK